MGQRREGICSGSGGDMTPPPREGPNSQPRARRSDGAAEKQLLTDVPSTGRALNHKVGDFNYRAERTEERDFFYSRISAAWGKSRVFPFYRLYPTVWIEYSEKYVCSVSTRI